jgi:trk system potassium uptake protein TrkA
VARENFGVENVVARIYDPGRAEVYQRLGIPTVGTVRWTVDQMIRRLLPSGSEPEWRDPSGSVRLAEVHAHSGWVGRLALDIERATGARVAFLTRLGEGLLPTADTVIQEGDLVHMVMLERDAATVESQLGTKPEEL